MIAVSPFPFGHGQTGRKLRDVPKLRIARSFFTGLPITHVVLPTATGADCLARSAPVFAPSLHGTMAA
jgi:hypothetical protein